MLSYLPCLEAVELRSTYYSTLAF